MGENKVDKLSRNSVKVKYTKQFKQEKYCART